MAVRHRPATRGLPSPRTVIALLVALSSTALALEEVQGGASLQRFTPAVDPLGAFSVGSGEVLRPGGYALGLHLNYARNPLVVREQGVRVASTLQNVVALQLHGAVHLASFLQLGFGLPFVAYQDGNDPRLASVAAYALGDLELQPRIQLLSQARYGIGLALTPGVTIPLGNAQAFAGEASFTFTPRLSVSHVFSGAFISGDLWFHARPEVKLLRYTTLGNELGVRIAGGLSLTEQTELVLEADGALAFSTADAAFEGNPLELIGGVRHHLSDQLAVEVGLGVGILSAPGTPDVRVVTGLTWGNKLKRATPMCQRETPEGLASIPALEKDADQDGFDDACDACPAAPEDRNGFQDGDGCPDPDRDGDGVFDPLDECVEEPGLKPTGCPDRDGDGLLDRNDSCPADPGPAPTGCPDRDGDGLFDKDDVCPDQPEDKDGFEDADGCPDPDNDQDGVLDAQDACPLVAEDKDGFEDADGCPDPDNDQDGILDAADKCPSEKETINGVDDGDGCPDKGKTLVVVKKDRIEILDKVYFATDKDIIEKRSFGLLKQVALTILAHPEIARIRVEGHTDDVGGHAHNVDLSQRRGESVVRFLVKEGVDGKRLIPKGFADDRPLVPNTNAKNRATNRRVEFNIVSDETGAE